MNCVIPFRLRDEYAEQCARCGGRKSVKYDVLKPDLVNTEPWCNVCVFRYIVAGNYLKEGGDTSSAK